MGSLGSMWLRLVASTSIQPPLPTTMTVWYVPTKGQWIYVNLALYHKLPQSNWWRWGPYPCFLVYHLKIIKCHPQTFGWWSWCCQVDKDLGPPSQGVVAFDQEHPQSIRRDMGRGDILVTPSVGVGKFWIACHLRWWRLQHSCSTTSLHWSWKCENPSTPWLITGRSNWLGRMFSRNLEVACWDHVCSRVSIWWLRMLEKCCQVCIYLVQTLLGKEGSRDAGGVSSYWRILWRLFCIVC